MPVPTSFANLNVNPNLCSPAGSEPVGTNLDDYVRALSAFIAQLYGGTYLPTQTVNYNNQAITGLAAAPTDPTSAVNLQQLINSRTVGEVRMWSGTATQTAVAAAWGAGWFLCNGANGTPNLMDRFIVGSGNSYTTGNTGGIATYSLTTSQLPVHNHGVTDPGHAHSVYDPGHAHSVADPTHAHGVADPGHSHAQPNLGSVQAGSDNGGTGVAVANSYGTSRGQGPVSASGTGIGIYGAATGIGIYAAGTNIGIYANMTGISTQNTGTGASIENRPPYYALAYVMYTGAGVV